MTRSTIHLPRAAEQTPRTADLMTKADAFDTGPGAPTVDRLRAAPADGEEDVDTWCRLSELRDDDQAGADDRGDPTGHFVVKHADIEHEIAAAGFDGTYDALSSGEEQRVRALHKMLARPLFRRHAVGDAALLDRLAALDAAAPNFAAVTRLVQDAVHVSMVGRAPLGLPPLLLVGPAGIGKSRYARALALALGTSVEEVFGSTLSDPLALTGHDTSWRGAGMGRVARALLASPTSAPLVFVDECEKIDNWNGKPHPIDVLLPVLEPQTAQRFVDDYLKVPMRADRALWLFACNALDGLSAPFLDRVVVVPVAGLGSAGRTQVLRAMFSEACRAVAVPMQLADDAALAAVRDLSLRRTRVAFTIAIAGAVAANRRFVTGADLATAVALLERPADQRPIGFLPTARQRGD